MSPNENGNIRNIPPAESPVRLICPKCGSNEGVFHVARGGPSTLFGRVIWISCENPECRHESPKTQLAMILSRIGVDLIGLACSLGMEGDNRKFNLHDMLTAFADSIGWKVVLKDSGDDSNGSEEPTP